MSFQFNLHDTELLDLYNEYGLNEDNKTEVDLELIEDLADFESSFGSSVITSEQNLSEVFDQMVDEFGAIMRTCDQSLDSDAMTQWFNNWSDSLVKDDQLHSEQYNHYGYCGKYEF